MKCIYCGSEFSGHPQYCPNCKQPLPRAKKTRTYDDAFIEAAPAHTRPQRALIRAAIFVTVLLAIFGISRLATSISAYRVDRLYTRGALTPTRNEVRLSDGRSAHTIAFYGNDGDQIFLPELQRSLSISGGVARVTIADSDWFGEDVSDIESADVRLTPVLITEKGKRTKLPAVEMNVAVPDSPLTVISPAQDGLRIVTSRYRMEFQVVPGSTVLVNGQDVTDTVDRSGLLSQNVNVYPIGENIYTIMVRTPRHHETRYDVTIYREQFDINIELDTSVSNVSNNDTMAITGIAEPGSTVSVDTDYVPESLIHDQTTGAFRFIAKFANYGENLVRFRASMEGKNDAVISMNVTYRPTLATMSAKAWKMDYDQLRRLYEQWQGRTFLCTGNIVDAYEDNGSKYVVMDVGTDGEQNLVVLENQSSVADPILGRRYSGYAYVTGRQMYKAQYYPMLCCLYLDLASN